MWVNCYSEIANRYTKGEMFLTFSVQDTGVCFINFNAYIHQKGLFICCSSSQNISCLISAWLAFSLSLVSPEGSETFLTSLYKIAHTLILTVVPISFTCSFFLIIYQYSFQTSVSLSLSFSLSVSLSYTHKRTYDFFKYLSSLKLSCIMQTLEWVFFPSGL